MDILDKGWTKQMRSVDKLYYYAQRKGANIKKKEIKEYIDGRKVRSRVRKYNKALMGNKFSAIRNTWQMDTYFDDSGAYLILINVNTHFAWCCKRKNDSTDDLIRCLTLFLKDHNADIIECDNESSFVSYKSVKFMRENGIIEKVFPTSIGHEGLTIMNKFTRTLRVMSREDDVPNIPLYIKNYNKSYHSRIKMAPRDMQRDPNRELRYIYDQLAIRDEKNKLALKDEIKKGDKVRYIRDEDRHSHRFDKDIMKNQLSKHYYIVEYRRSPLSYDIVAEDGSVKTVPRYRLFKLTKTEEKTLTLAKTIEDDSSHIILDEILDYDPMIGKKGPSKGKLKTGSNGIPLAYYTIRVISRDKNGRKRKKNEERTVYSLRGEVPTQPTTLELEFYRKHKDEYAIDKESGYLVPRLPN